MGTTQNIEDQNTDALEALDLLEGKEADETSQLRSAADFESPLQISLKFKLIVGVITGTFIIFIYTYMVIHMMTPLAGNIANNLVPTWKSIITTIGGLISAVMVAIFAATPSDEPMFEGDKLPFSILICLFASVWFLVGMFTFLFGTLQPAGAAGTEKFHEIISFLGLNWLATAVAGTYAFLGLNPPKKPEGN